MGWVKDLVSGSKILLSELGSEDRVGHEQVGNSFDRDDCRSSRGQQVETQYNTVYQQTTPTGWTTTHNICRAISISPAVRRSWNGS